MAAEEKSGAVFKDDGRPEDALKIVKAHGWTKFGTLFKAGAEGVCEGAKPGRVPSIMLMQTSRCIRNMGAGLDWCFRPAALRRRKRAF